MKPLTEVLEAVKRTIPEQGSALDPRKMFAERAKSRPTLNDFQAGLEILKETIRLGMGTESKLLDVCRYAVGLLWLKHTDITNDEIFGFVSNIIQDQHKNVDFQQRLADNVNSTFFYKIKPKFSDIEMGYAMMIIFTVWQETDNGNFYLYVIMAFAINCLRLMGNSSTV